VIAEGYLPADDATKPRELISHEAACILNASDEAAALHITFFFTDREPSGPHAIELPARRTLHLRLNEVGPPGTLPPATDYSTLIEANVPVVVQHTRLDSRAGWALLSTLAFASD
jgi:hypothetical protein